MKKKSAFSAKLASLTAVGAGAMALTAGKAEAAIIYQPISLKAGWDFSAGYAASQSTQLAGSARLGFLISGRSNSYQGNRAMVASIFRSIASIGFQQAGSFQTIGCGCGTLKIMNNGALWSGPGTSFGTALVGGRRWFVYPQFSGTPTGSGPGSSFTPPPNTSQTFGNAAFTDGYALFRFQPTTGSGFLYGWMELNLSMNKDAGINPGDGPNVDVLAFAYDDSGALIAAGDNGSAPEPASVAMSGLAALLLGAEGLRRHRKCKHPIS